MRCLLYRCNKVHVLSGIKSLHRSCCTDPLSKSRCYLRTLCWTVTHLLLDCVLTLGLFQNSVQRVLFGLRCVCLSLQKNRLMTWMMDKLFHKRQGQRFRVSIPWYCHVISWRLFSSVCQSLYVVLLEMKKQNKT